MRQAATVAAGERATVRAWGVRDLLQLRYVAVFTAIATYGLIVLGGTVRATDSGTACPDWPLCHGQVVPPFETKVMIEYAHRVVASVVGLLILGTAAWAWRRRAQEPLAARAGVAAAALLALQVVVGGVTVNTETDATVVAVHLTIALSLLTVLIALASAAFLPGATGLSLRRVPALAFVAAAAIFALIIVGAFVSQEEAGLAYPDWPLFDGGIGWAASKAGELHYAHRAVAGVTGVLLGWLAFRTLRSERDVVALGAMTVAFALYSAQVVVGASNIWFELATSVRILHLALASLLWAALMLAIVRGHALRPDPAEAR